MHLCSEYHRLERTDRESPCQTLPDVNPSYMESIPWHSHGGGVEAAAAPLGSCTKEENKMEEKIWSDTSTPEQSARTGSKLHSVTDAARVASVCELVFPAVAGRAAERGAASSSLTQFCTRAGFAVPRVVLAASTRDLPASVMDFL